MPQCPYCGDNVPVLKEHLERAFAEKKNKNLPAKWMSTRGPDAGTWYPV